MLRLDHLVVAGETLEEAVAHAEASLGLPMQNGGKHARFGTHNRVAGLDRGHYLEAIAIDPGAPPPDRPRWFGLDTFRGPARLAAWVCRVPDLDAAVARLPMAGCPVEMSRGRLEWRMAVPEDGALPFDGVFPALIEWRSPVPPGTSLSSTGLAIDRLEVAHPEAAELSRLLTPLFDEQVVLFRPETVPALRAALSSDGRARILQ
ncbi:VOC family protein [Roseivivax marinus]|uniref:VOC family protein n=1 Tax=Roseivivax marinus TaxID=1379903 RepID=UPI0035157398